MLLKVDNLSISFPSPNGPLRAVRNCRFSIAKGEIVGLVGESGSGKSLTAMSCLGLLPSADVTGSIELDGTQIVGAKEDVLRRFRGRIAAMIFQNPSKALNPFFRIGEQVCTTIAISRDIGIDQARQEAIIAFRDVRLSDPEIVLRKYPHQFSGGQLQRIMIAMAIACAPQLLIADEPTTALDVTVQAQVVELIRDLARQRGLAVLFITHDLALVSSLCDRLMVMYAGQIVETGGIPAIFETPRHPYTGSLLQAVPKLGGGKKKLQQIPGQVPSLATLPSGCTFHPRCPNSRADCTLAEPVLVSVPPDRSYACFHPVSRPTNSA